MDSNSSAIRESCLRCSQYLSTKKKDHFKKRFDFLISTFFMKTIITMPLTIEPSDCDILLGRFKRSFNHPGNIRFRALINESVELYMQACTRREKGIVIKGLYNRLISQGCRFLKQYGKLWVNVSDHPISRDKISHAIRDAVSTHTKNGMLGNLWECAQQQSLTSKSKSKKRNKTNNFRRDTAMKRMTTKIPCTSLDEAQHFGQPILSPVVLQHREDGRGYNLEPIPFSTLSTAPCLTSQYTDQCEVTHPFTSLLPSDAITVTNSIGIGISLPPFHDVEYDSLNKTKNECLCSSPLMESMVLPDLGIQGQNPITGNRLSLYDILRNASDICSDGEDHCTEACETWEDKVAKPFEDIETLQWHQWYGFAR